MNTELIELIEELKDRLENINASLSLKVPDKIHVEASRDLFPELIDDLNNIAEKARRKSDG